MTWTQNLQRAVPGFELRTSAAGESLVLTGGVHERTLQVFCDEGEFTVAFAGWHTHTEDETHVIELAKLITDDDQVVMTAYRGAVSRCSQLCPPHEEEWVDFITTPFSFDVPDRFEVLSWSGKHDRSYPP